MSIGRRVTADPDTNASAILASLYTWGARLIGGILMVGIIAQAATFFFSFRSESVGQIIAIWPTVSMLGLWAVPVLSLSVAGCTWVMRDRHDWTGWMAIGIGVFLSSLWILQ
jgi:cytochrome c-type biogenesis protein CcmH/NrfF